MTRRKQDVSEEEIQAFVDGDLESKRREQIAALIPKRPDLAQRVEQYRAISGNLHRLFDDVLHEPIPDDLLRIIAGKAKDD